MLTLLLAPSLRLGMIIFTKQKKLMFDFSNALNNSYK